MNDDQLIVDNLYPIIEEIQRYFSCEGQLLQNLILDFLGCWIILMVVEQEFPLPKVLVEVKELCPRLLERDFEDIASLWQPIGLVEQGSDRPL